MIHLKFTSKILVPFLLCVLSQIWGSEKQIKPTSSFADASTSLTIIGDSQKLNGAKLDTKFPFVSLPDGIQFQDIVIGKGQTPNPNDTVYLHFIRYLDNGTEVVNTFKEKRIPYFIFGIGTTAKAFEEAISTMKEGGKRRIIIPKKLFSTQEIEAFQDNETSPSLNINYTVSFLWLRKPEFDKVNKFKIKE